MALDHPQAVAKLALLDIAPTLDMYAATDMAFARAYYHWFHLIQPAPLPERMIGGVARDYLHAKLGGWGSGGLAHVEPAALAEYERCFSDPAAIHAMCEDYRAAASIDLAHDAPMPRRASPVRYMCCGVSAALCTACSHQWRTGRPRRAGPYLAAPCPAGTTLRKRCPTCWSARSCPFLRAMSDVSFHRNLRLGLVGFAEQDAHEIAAIVKALWTPKAPWVISAEMPVDGVLLARGTRPGDPDNAAVLRVNLSRKPVNSRDAERRLEPLMVRKPSALPRCGSRWKRESQGSSASANWSDGAPTANAALRRAGQAQPVWYAHTVLLDGMSRRFWPRLGGWVIDAEKSGRRDFGAACTQAGCIVAANTGGRCAWARSQNSASSAVRR